MGTGGDSSAFRAAIGPSSAWKTNPAPSAEYGTVALTIGLNTNPMPWLFAIGRRRLARCDDAEKATPQLSGQSSPDDRMYKKSCRPTRGRQP